MSSPSSLPQPTTDTVPALGRLPLAREAVDRGGAERMAEDWAARVWADPATRVLLLADGRAPVLDGRLALVPPEGSLPQDTVYLGRSTDADRTPLMLLTVVADPRDPADAAGQDASPGGPAPAAEDDDAATARTLLARLPQDVRWLGLRDAAAALSDRDAGLFVEAVSIANWHAMGVHCARCGTVTEPTQSGWVRVCPQDGSEHFPRTDPAVIVAVVDAEDRLLLGNNAAWPAGRFSTLAGFVEPGESLEHAVVREIEEESGLRVTAPRYLGSQPWPFPRSLMVGFTALAEDPSATRPDGEEIMVLRWFTRQQLAEAVRASEVTLPPGVSISRALIEHWYGGPLPEPRELVND